MQLLRVCGRHRRHRHLGAGSDPPPHPDSPGTSPGSGSLFPHHLNGLRLYLPDRLPSMALPVLCNVPATPSRDPAPASPVLPAAGRHTSGLRDTGCGALVGTRVVGRGAGVVVGFAAVTTERGWGPGWGSGRLPSPTAPCASALGDAFSRCSLEERQTVPRASLCPQGGGDGMGTSWLSADAFVAGTVACRVPGSTKCTRRLRMEHRQEPAPSPATASLRGSAVVGSLVGSG